MTLTHAKHAIRPRACRGEQPVPCGEPARVGNARPEQSTRTRCSLCCGPGGGARGSWPISPSRLGLLSPGSFHLIHLMFDDYVLYLLESLHCQERANELMRAMKGEGSTGKPAGPSWALGPVSSLLRSPPRQLCVPKGAVAASRPSGAKPFLL